MRDHPRVRGEHSENQVETKCFLGSSPRARGTPLPAADVVAVRGIIPACAGNTRAALGPELFIGDHPRVRGEHLSPQSARPNGSGSSPRARGTLPERGFLVSPRGIIPACAGNTLIQPSKVKYHGDHPRVRGEHTGLGYGDLVTEGSSPRARGTHPLLIFPPIARGIIPARAGNTSPR